MNKNSWNIHNPNKDNQMELIQFGCFEIKIKKFSLLKYQKGPNIQQYLHRELPILVIQME